MPAGFIPERFKIGSKNMNVIHSITRLKMKTIQSCKQMPQKGI